MIERWEGMPPTEAAPGNVWWHDTVCRDTPHGARLPAGVTFEAGPDATEAELRAAATAAWAKQE